jgi:hypothetical protein
MAMISTAMKMMDDVDGKRMDGNNIASDVFRCDNSGSDVIRGNIDNSGSDVIRGNIDSDLIHGNNLDSDVIDGDDIVGDTVNDNDIDGDDIDGIRVDLTYE